MSEQFIYQSVFAPYFKDFLAMKENQVSDIGRISGCSWSLTSSLLIATSGMCS